MTERIRRPKVTKSLPDRRTAIRVVSPRFAASSPKIFCRKSAPCDFVRLLRKVAVSFTGDVSLQ